MNAVGTDQDVTVSGGAVRAGAVKEIGGDAGFILAKGAEAMPGMDAMLAEAIGIEQLVSADRDRIESLQKPERGELLDRMRQRIDADTEFADLLGLLEHLALDAARVQHQRGGQPANPAACDDRFHGCRSSETDVRDLEYQITSSPTSDLRHPISCHSGWMFALRITSPQRCVSSFTKALASAGVPPPGPMLSAANRSRNPGSRIAAFAAALSLVTMSGGVFGGAVMACQVSEMQPWTPTSSKVGMSGSDGTRSFTVTARMRACPDLFSSIEVASSLNIRSTLPASKSLTAGAVPL